MTLAHCTCLASGVVHIDGVSIVPVYVVMTAPIVIEGADHGRTLVHDGRGKPCAWWGLRVP
jgi:hypothetical protein